MRSNRAAPAGAGISEVISTIVMGVLVACGEPRIEAKSPAGERVQAAAPEEVELPYREGHLPHPEDCDLSFALQDAGVDHCYGTTHPLPECLPREAVSPEGHLVDSWCTTVCGGYGSKCVYLAMPGETPGTQAPGVACLNCADIGRRPEGLVPVNHDAPSPLAAWLGMAAHLEAAAVHAFRRLEGELAQHGAPRSLVAQARRAARDEVRHARRVGRAARRRGARPAPVVVAAVPERTTFAIAHENAVEGCVRETYGAAVATWQAARAADPELRCILQSIAGDERRHAALSWATNAFLEPKLSAPERVALRDARARAIADLRHELAADYDATLAHAAGLPSAREAAQLLDALAEALWRA